MYPDTDGWEDVDDEVDFPLPSTTMTDFVQNRTGDFPPRAGHVAVVDPPRAQNLFNQKLVIYGGDNADGILADCWTWGGRKGLAEPWREDYTVDAWYKYGDGGSDQRYQWGQPQYWYVTPYSDIDFLQRFTLPISLAVADRNQLFGLYDEPLLDGGTWFRGHPSLREPLLDAEQVQMLRRVGINTIHDLTTADKLTILRLRGYDFPQVPPEKRFDFENICDIRELAKAIVNKCSLRTKIDTMDTFYVHPRFDGEMGQPANLVPLWNGGHPGPGESEAKWYGVNYTLLQDDDGGADTWDGCVNLPNEPDEINVMGIGKVEQVRVSFGKIRDPWRELGELQCRWNPGARTGAVGAYFNEMVYVMGGRVDEDAYAQDMWYRDDWLPFTYIFSSPANEDDDMGYGSVFTFDGNKQGVIFEWLLYNRDEFLIVQHWTRTTRKIDLAWMAERKFPYITDSFKGPGPGRYVLYVRGIDPAGNVDYTFKEKRNMYSWTFSVEPDWQAFVVLGITILTIIGAAYFEYRRRKKKRAMERYAIKRMRRKFKSAQKEMTKGKGDVDWKEMMDDGKKKKKKKKKGKDKDKKKKDKKKKGKDKDKEKKKKKKE